MKTLGAREARRQCWWCGLTGHCPGSSVRCASGGCRHVYLLDPIACRRCHHLDYASRHLYRQTPAVHRVARWRKQIGADPRPFAPLPERPKRIVEKIRTEEEQLVRLRVRKSKGKW
jgi:hypothetical protein